VSFLDAFSASYREARSKFVEAAAAAGAALESVPHPMTGPAGESLSTDVAWLGDRDGKAALVAISATHGAEGFAGSAAQVDWLARGEAERLPAGIGVLLIHAINPYGFAWLRRVTNENVDLNRNWIDFNKPLPENQHYKALASAICPKDWLGEGRKQADLELAEFAAAHGKGALQQALSGGQYAHPEGIFYGGSAPTWSRKTQTAILMEYLKSVSKIGVIDFHTGLGPWGLGERIATPPRASAEFARAARWYGAGVVSPRDGSSSSAPIVGDGLSAIGELLPGAEVTGMALEFGTLSIEKVLDAVRADAWLHAYGDPKSPAGQSIQKQVRDAFFGDSEDWKGMILGQSLLAMRQAISGLSL
jgi:hypothetical protein